MRSRNLARLAALLAVAISGAALAAQDPAVDASSAFKRRAKAITILGVEDLEARATEKTCKGGKGDGSPDAKLWDVVPVEIGGSNTDLIATFRLVDGSRDDFRVGGDVPGLGRIKSVDKGGVHFTNGHYLPLEQAND
jgi:hypothetical protein